MPGDRIELSEERRKALVESHQAVRRAFHEAEKAVRLRSPDELVEVARAHALANDLINQLRQVLGMGAVR